MKLNIFATRNKIAEEITEELEHPQLPQPPLRLFAPECWRSMPAADTLAIKTICPYRLAPGQQMPSITLQTKLILRPVQAQIQTGGAL